MYGCCSFNIKKFFNIKEAIRKGIEGWVLLEFDVNKKGQAINIKMIDHEPKGKIFKENSIKALKRWKFDPAVVDGEKVITKSVKHVFTFSLTDN